MERFDGLPFKNGVRHSEDDQCSSDHHKRIHPARSLSGTDDRERFSRSSVGRAGDTVTLDIVVNNVANLHLYHVVVHFDNTIIRCEGLTNGGFLPGTFFFSIPATFPSDTARFVTVDDALIGTQTRTGSGRLFSMRFTALRIGVSPVILVETVLRDGANQNITHSNADGAVTVTGPLFNRTVHVEAGWNMISVPLRVADYRTTVLFPTAVSSAFRFENGYAIAETLQNGTGYWLKFPGSQNVTLSGTLMTVDTIDVFDGWNMVGGLSDNLLPSRVVPVPPVTILSSFFGFRSAGGYVVADTLKTGGGYWVKVSAAGRLVLQEAP